MEYGNHRPRGRYGFSGTPFFGTSKALQGFTQSKRDDMESLGYSILLLINPDYRNIPWVQCELNDLKQVLK